MSQHPSLRVSSVGKKHRNVLKRHERVKRMMAEGRWKEDRNIYNLPKMKSIKIKVKKGGGRGPKEEGAEKKPEAGAAKKAS